MNIEVSFSPNFVFYSWLLQNSNIADLDSIHIYL